MQLSRIQKNIARGRGEDHIQSFAFRTGSTDAHVNRDAEKEINPLAGGLPVAARGERKSDLLGRTRAGTRENERVARGLEKFMGFPLHGALISVAVSPVLPGK